MSVLCDRSGRGAARERGSAARLAWSGLAVVGALLSAAAAAAQTANDPAGRDAALENAIREAQVPPAVPHGQTGGPRTPASLAADGVTRLGLSAQSRAVRLTAHSAAARQAYGPAKAGEGRALLVVDLELENIIPLTLVRDRQVATEYQIPNLSDHLYLVIDGTRLARLRGDGDELPGHLPVKEFKLRMIGTTARGNAVFEVPAGGVKTVELRYYDYAHGHVAMKLAGTEEAFAAAAAAQPLAPPQKNEVVEAGVFALDRVAELHGTKAPDGMTYVVADLRARSTFTVEADAEAFDPKARKGSKAKIGHVADWKESRRYLQLVADGQYAYMPEPQTELGEEPRFLPDVMTGGKVVFLAPADAKSLELRCDFPNARASTGVGTFRPKGMTLALEGKRPAPPGTPAIASVDDDTYRIQVLGQRAAAEFAGQAAGEGKKFLVLDMVVINQGHRNGEFFQTKEQLKYAAETGEQSPLSPATFEGVRRPPELIWIPPGERRAFEAAYEIGAAETRPRLAFTGVSKAQVLNLKQLEATAVAARPPGGGNTPAPAKQPAQQPAKQPAKAPVEVAANANPGTMQAKAPATPAAPPAQVTAPAVKDPPAAPAQNIKPIRVAAKQPHTPKGLAGVGLTPEQVNAAIDRGAEALWAHQKEINKKGWGGFGSNLGYDALVALALVHSNYHKKSPEFDAELRAMLARIDPPAMGTYGAGVLAMLIEAYGDGTYLPKMKQTVRCLVESQGPQGSWGYTAKAPEALLKDPVAEKVLQIRGGVPLEGEGAAGEVMKRQGEYHTDWDGDNSTSQYALLGLWSAARSKVNVEPEAWKRALKIFRERQTDDGGWHYQTHGGYGYGSMTCAGICSVALARHHLGEAAPAEDPAVERGLAWLVNHFSVSKHPESSDNHLFYYLSSLERVGRVLDTEFIGPHEWYPLGARFLIDKQQPDGTWKGFGDEERPVLASSFALLFLTRATATLNVDPKRGGEGTLRTDVAAAPGHRVYIILDSSGTMMEEIDGVQRHKVSRDAMADLVAEMPETTELALRTFGHRKAANQAGANEDTELLVPLGKLDRQKVVAALTNLRARGKTPLSLTLSQVAEDVKSGASADKPTTVVFVTDGGEDNTRPPKPPLAAAEALAGIPGVALYVVGFDIQRPEWVEQLRGLAAAGGGHYLAAQDPQSLLPGLRAAVYRTPESFVLLDARGRPVRQAAFKEELKLPEGKYSISTDFGGKRYTEALWINTDATTAVVFDAAKIGVDKSGQDATRGAAAGAPAGRGAPNPAAPGRAAPGRTAPGRGAAAGTTPAPAAPPAGAKKYCTSCGSPLAANARFCTKCGAKVGG